MIKIIKGGNLIEAKELVIAHQVNCQRAMGSGVALAIKNKYPQHYIDYMNDQRIPEEKLGTVVKTILPDRQIYGLYGQFYYGGEPGVVYTNYHALGHAIVLMVLQSGAKDFALPYLIGCGLAGGDWNNVKNILTFISKEYMVNFYLYDLMNQSEGE